MVDKGFHHGGAGSIHVYFGLLIGVVAALAVASGLRYYLVMTIGERIVADLRGDFFRHLTTMDQTFFDAEKTGEIVSRLSVDTTQLKSTFGSSASRGAAQLFSCSSAPIALMIATSPETLGLRADRDPAHRPAALRRRPFRARALAPRPADARRRHRLRQPRASTPRASCRRSSPRISPPTATPKAAEGAYEAAREMTQRPRHRHRASPSSSPSPASSWCCGSARATSLSGRLSAGAAAAIPALCGARREFRSANSRKSGTRSARPPARRRGSGN